VTEPLQSRTLVSVDTRRLLYRTLCLLVVCAFAGPGPVSAWDLSTGPGVVIPVGDSTTWFTPGPGLTLATHQPVGTDGWFAVGAAQGRWWPYPAKASLLVGSLAAGFGWEHLLAPGWSAGFEAQLGAYVAGRTDLQIPGSNPLVSTGCFVRWRLEPSLSFVTNLDYQNAIGLYQAIALRCAFVVEDTP